MPNPKLGTVTMDVTKAVREAKAGKVEYKVEKAGIIHCGIGKSSMESEKLTDNFKALFEHILRQKPSSTKGNYVKAITVSSTMGPGVKVDISEATSLSSSAED
jgi:large subunit ribosomal protein L1